MGPPLDADPSDKANATAPANQLDAPPSLMPKRPPPDAEPSLNPTESATAPESQQDAPPSLMPKRPPLDSDPSPKVNATAPANQLDAPPSLMPKRPRRMRIPRTRQMRLRR